MTTANNFILEALLTEHDVARITGLSVASVRRWRLLQQGPKYMKLGASVRYKPDDISAWLASRPTGGEQTGRRTMQANKSRLHKSDLQNGALEQGGRIPEQIPGISTDDVLGVRSSGRLTWSDAPQ